MPGDASAATSSAFPLDPMRVLLALALALSLAACDVDGVDTGDTFPIRSFVEINPRATYLLSVSDGNALPAIAVSLEAIGFEPGATVCFRAQGDYFIDPGFLASNQGPILLTAVFSRTSEILVPSQRVRLPGAVATTNGRPVVTLPALVGSAATDIAQDFDATNSCVAIPSDARFVFFSTFAEYFGNNLDARINREAFGVRISRP